MLGAKSQFTWAGELKQDRHGVIPKSLAIFLYGDVYLINWEVYDFHDRSTRGLTNYNKTKLSKTAIRFELWHRISLRVAISFRIPPFVYFVQHMTSINTNFNGICFNGKFWRTLNFKNPVAPFNFSFSIKNLNLHSFQLKNVSVLTTSSQFLNA